MARADESIRAFAAIELSDAVRSSIEDLIRRLSGDLPNVSWIRIENIHLTLRFFGNVAPEFIDGYAEQLATITAKLSSFDASVEGLGAFPSSRRPSIIWVGMVDPDSEIESLQAEAERAARELGLERESRPFVPHITIGRVRRGASRFDAAPVLSRERDFSAGAMTVDAVSLFSSTLTPQGARYTRLHRLTLDGIRGESDI